jgi:hypothetical protein
VYYLKDVAKAQGDELVLHRAVIWGGTLKQHWEKAEVHARNPTDPSGLYDKTQVSLTQELAASKRHGEVLILLLRRRSVGCYQLDDLAFHPISFLDVVQDQSLERI